MVRTMFGKILILVIALLIISFTLTGIIMNAVLNKMVTDQLANQLETVSEKVITALDTVIKNEAIKDPYLFINYIQTLAANADSLIWIVSEDGTIIYYSEIPENIQYNLTESQEGLFKLPDERQYIKQPSEYEVGDYFGLFKGTGIDWVTYNKPFVIRNIPPYSLEARGMILIHSRIPSIYQLKHSIFLVFVAAGVIGGIIALIFVALLTKHITKPMNQMKAVAKKVASGEFTGRINVKGKDELSELSKSFNEMITELENLEKMRRDFIGNVSHELRTPLTSIKGFVDGIIDGVIPPEKHEYYLRIVRDETSRMQDLVNDLLSLAKLQGGEVALEYSIFDINELIRRSVISLQQMFLEKNLEFNALFETERMFVRADLDSIQRVIINLLHNAIKFTPENGVIAAKTYYEKNKVVISIEDSGRGIPKEDLPGIFERFYKTDKSRSEDRTGVGLGLAIVRNIINKHDETIKVESQEGHGTRFIFTLSKAPEPV
ncbi:MAG: HAMP domain-containing protein [Clostridiaceae bacterium]|jgi:signal transduction histidine kinase|nr:HAMP domain-containing protein [Clostridiaceae bacterium]